MTHETGLDKIVLHNPRSVVAFDAEGDGSMDFLVTQNNLPPVLLKNIGGNKNNWLKFALTGDPDNNVAIGTRTEVFSGALRQTWEVSGASGYLSQGPPEIHAGLGDEGGADVVRILWPTGVLQNQIQIAGGNQAPIAEAEPVTDEPDKEQNLAERVRLIKTSLTTISRAMVSSCLATFEAVIVINPPVISLTVLSRTKIRTEFFAAKSGVSEGAFQNGCRV